MSYELHWLYKIEMLPSVPNWWYVTGASSAKIANGKTPQAAIVNAVNEIRWAKASEIKPSWYYDTLGEDEHYRLKEEPIIYIVVFTDQDWYQCNQSAWRTREGAQKALDDFVAQHQGDPHWRLDTGEIEEFYLND